MSNYTWNIMFIAVDTGFDVNLNKNPSNDAVSDAIKKFEQEVNATSFTNSININTLLYLNTKNNAEVKLQTLCNGNKILDVPNDDVNNMYMNGKFDCLNTTFYSKFIKKHFKHGDDQKNMIIFLAHSFGAGYFSFQEAGAEKIVFTTINLNTAIQHGIQLQDNDDIVINKKLDCLLAYNCSVQSIETNYIFKDTVSLLLASQQTLYPENIFFKDMLIDMDLFSHKPYTNIAQSFTDEHLFTKFIYDCNRNAIEANQINKEGTCNTALLKPFGLCLTRPYNAKFIFTCLNIFAAQLYQLSEEDTTVNVMELITQSKRFCEDPTSDDQISIIDAKQFFAKLKEESYPKASIKGLTAVLDLILNYIDKLIVASLTTGNSADAIDLYDTLENCQINFYIPSGVGVFIPKSITNAVNEILKVHRIIDSRDGTKNFDYEIGWSELVLDQTKIQSIGNHNYFLETNLKPEKTILGKNISNKNNFKLKFRKNKF